jgi:glycosyltransferase involved in cell wall biosynthesis
VLLVGELSVDEFAGLVRSAQVIVSPSYSDGMPVAILGAVASGSRIVAGDLPQLKELADGGADIDLIDASETHEIAAAIVRQLQSTKDAANTDLPDEYSRSKNAKRVPHFYRAVLFDHSSMMERRS